MSALAYPYSEPFKLPAGLLALAVHIVFFAFLYWGISWRNEPPQGMEVEIWSKLPAPQMAHAPAPPPALQPEPPRVAEPPKPVEPQPLAPPKADIELAKKKAPKIKPPPPRELPVPPAQPKKAEPLRVDRKAEEEAAKAKAAAQAKAAAEAAEKAKAAEAERAAEAAEAAQAAEATRAAEADLNRARAAREASATGKVVNDFVGRIRNKIKSNIIMPPNVPDDAEAEFDVTLLPDGSVLNISKVKASGNAEWDSAVERAIVKSHILPLPPDPTLFGRYFRDLHLKFRPKEKE
jgi:colicin import membrane protein